MRGLILFTSGSDIVNDVLRDMARGVQLNDAVTLPCRIERLGRTQFRIVLVQGLNRQIRRMCEAFGYRVTQLQCVRVRVRVRVVNIKLGRPRAGEWRNLMREELRGLLPVRFGQATRR